MSRLDGWLHRFRVRLRGEAHAREQVGETEVQLALDRLRQDLTYAWRGWRRSWGTAGAIVLTFALGVGANGAIFSFLDRLLLRPPTGVIRPNDVRRFYVARPQPAGAQSPAAVNVGFSFPEYAAIRDAVRPNALVAALLGTDSTSVVRADAELPVRRSFVTAGYLPLLSGAPSRGRFFTADEDDLDAPAPVAVVTDAAWARLFARDSTIIGQTVAIGGTNFEVIGVTPEGFGGLDADATDVFVPAAWRSAGTRDGTRWYQRQDWYIDVVARIAPNVTDAGVAGAASVAVRTAAERPTAADSGLRVLLGPALRERGPMGKARETAIAVRLIGIAGMLLLIACANIGNLLLARATRRRKEIAIRRALGVSRRRLLGQLLVESLLVAGLAGAMGIVVAGIGGSVLRTQLSPRTHWSAPAIDARVALVAFGAAILCGLASGLAPALVALRQDVGDALKTGGHGTTPAHARLRAALLATQAALSVVLLAGAAVFLRSLHHARAVDMGFDLGRVIVADVGFTDGRRHPELAERLQALADRVRAIPGADRVALASGAPLVSTMWMPVRSPDIDSIPWVNGQPPELVNVSPDYFAALGLRVVAGRGFTDRDDARAPRVVVINETMANALWPNASPVGRCLIDGPPTSPCATVVGVVSDARNSGLRLPAAMTWYLPLAQVTWLPHALVVRASSGRADALASVVQRELRAAFPTAAVRAASLEVRLGPQLRPWRLSASLFTAFGLLALLVAGVGVYSVVSCVYSERVHEMGIRLALGAAPGDLTRFVMGSGLRAVGAGVVVGTVLALSMSRLVASLLYDVSAHDPLSIAAAATLLCATGVVGALPPAWRATRVDPVAALRQE